MAFFQTRAQVIGWVLVSLCASRGTCLAQEPSDSAPAAAPDTAVPAITLTSDSGKTPAAPLTATDTLAGPLRDTLKTQKKPYFVVGDIEVPAGKTVTIEPGTILLFKGLTGLHVQGKLLAQGTKERPIIFTSENDRAIDSSTKAYPNPYDWNGIYLHSDAMGTIMSYCKVLYSVYGIVSETKFIRLDPVVCMRNGKSNLVIEGKQRQVTDAPFSYVLSTTDVKAEGIPVRMLNDPHALQRSVARYTGFTGLLVAAVAGIYYGMQWKQSQNNLSNYSADDPSGLHYRSEAEWLSLKNTRDKNRTYTGISGGAAAAALVCFVWSFRF